MASSPRGWRRLRGTEYVAQTTCRKESGRYHLTEGVPYARMTIREVPSMAPCGLDMTDLPGDTRLTEQARCLVPTAIVTSSDTDGRRNRP